MNPSHLTVTLGFNIDIASSWGGGAIATCSGNTVTLYWDSAPSSAEIIVNVDNGVADLQCTVSSCLNN